MPCTPKWIDLDLPSCQNYHTIQNSEQILQKTIKNMESICGNPCHFLQIRTSGRNVQSYDHGRFYAYFPYKTAMR